MNMKCCPFSFWFLMLLSGFASLHLWLVTSLCGVLRTQSHYPMMYSFCGVANIGENLKNQPILSNQCHIIGTRLLCGPVGFLAMIRDWRLVSGLTHALLHVESWRTGVLNFVALARVCTWHRSWHEVILRKRTSSRPFLYCCCYCSCYRCSWS